MNFSKALQNRHIKVDVFSCGASVLGPRVTLREKLLLFSVSSESFPHISRENVSVLSGELAGQGLFSAIELSDDDFELFLSSTYKPNHNAALFPIKDGLLFVFTRFLRAGGPGLALIIDCPPEAAAALARSELADSLGRVAFSPSFDKYSPIENNVMELYRSLSRFTASGLWDKPSIFDIIRSAAELCSIEVSTKLTIDANDGAEFDSDAVFSLLLCLLSHASYAGIKKADITLSGARSFCISVEFEESGASLSNDLLFCEKTAEHLGIPFNLDISEGRIRVTFIPQRDRPADGFKSGIFINGKRFINPFLKEMI